MLDLENFIKPKSKDLKEFSLDVILLLKKTNSIWFERKYLYLLIGYIEAKENFNLCFKIYFDTKNPFVKITNLKRYAKQLCIEFPDEN